MLLEKTKSPPIKKKAIFPIILIVDEIDDNFMFKIIRASFNQRRKTLQNGLNNASNLNVNKEQVVAALEKMGLPATVRGEALSLEQFAALSNLLKA